MGSGGEGECELTLLLPIVDWYAQASTHSGMMIEPLNSLDESASPQLLGEFHQDPADRILIAIVQRYGMLLVTCDNKILNYPHGSTVW